MLNLPNTITSIRILLVPVFLIFFWTSNPYHIYFGLGVLAVSGITDILDGYLARKYNLITPLGKILDPLADKLMVITSMVSLFLIGKMPYWLVVLIISKELCMFVGSFFLVVKRNVDISANIYGKTATFAIYMALFTGGLDIIGNKIIAGIAGVLSIIALLNYITRFSHTENR
jgi:cardiolipin synthase